MSPPEGPAPEVTLRRFPFPYRAMLAICSDLDETPDADVYFESARFLNTTQETGMGPGVGLEVGNTIFFDMPPGQFSYWGATEGDRERVRELMHSGHVDAIHSWGDLATKRRHAERNLEELSRHGCRLGVWIDHSKAPSNFGPDLMRGTGDLPGSPAYHSDLTLDYGIRYVWRGRTTGLTGQGVPVGPASLAPMLRQGRPLASGRAAAREVVKVLLGRLGRRRWALHGLNQVCTPGTLRDGRSIWELLRANPSPGGPGEDATAPGFARVLTPGMLKRLTASGGFGVLYTHLGKVEDPREPFGAETRQAFRLLATERDEGRILVTTTRRLLDYATMTGSLRWSTATADNRVVVTLEWIEDPVEGRRRPRPGELEGLTLTVATSRPVELRLGDGTLLPARTAREGSGRTRVEMPWTPLRFPPIRRA